jgi:glycosyltransferase involved in cell wall biosynthesis
VASSIDISIVVPAYNEESTIEEALRRLHGVIVTTGINFEIILVVDGYVDSTKDIALSLELPNLRVVGYEHNKGKGYALRFGSQQISGQFTAFFDGDLDIDASCLFDLYCKLVQSNADVVVGSKVHPDSVVSYPMFRRFQSQIMRWIVRFLFALDISDTQTGIKVFRTVRLQESINDVQTKGFSFDVDLLVRMHDRGCKIIDGPIVLNYQFSSTTGFRSSFAVLLNLLNLKIQRIQRRAQTK